MSSTPEICCSGSKCVVADSSCRASTSRGLSHSSGDFDDQDSQQNAGRCSCCSESYYVLEYCNKPCFIVDSSTKIHKSKWQTFKNYFKKRKISRMLKELSILEEGEKSSKKKSKKKNKREVEKSLEESETVKPETSHSPALS